MPEETYRGDEIFQEGTQIRDSFDRDLHAGAMARRNVDLQGQHPEKQDGVRTAYDEKDLHNALDGFGDDELKRIPILPPGTRLEQGATYIDLRGDRREVTATSEMTAGSNTAWVPKSEVDYQLWNRLIGVTNPERTGDADDGAVT
jgi:hypothetical protein